MGIFARIARRCRPMPMQAVSGDALPTLALPPIHQPVRSLSVFAGDTPLDPIPLGIGAGGLVSWNPQGRSGLQVFGGTGSGTTEFNRAVIEQCRTRGWQVLIADGLGFEFVGFRGTANVSYVGSWKGGDSPDDACLAALRSAHHIMIERSFTRAEARDSPRHKGFAPMLLVLGEVGGLLHHWQHHLDEAQYRHVNTMVDDLLCADPELRCYVLISPASGWKWRSPWPSVKRCDTVILGYPERTYAAHCADPAATMEAIEAAWGTASQTPRGRGTFVSADRSMTNPVVFQFFLTHNPCSDFSRYPYPLDVMSQWEQFRAAVSDKTPALHPQMLPED